MADEYRLVMSGDSITAGARYGWDKSTSTALEEMLNTTGSKYISVYDLRVTGYNTHQELGNNIKNERLLVELTDEQCETVVGGVGVLGPFRSPGGKLDKDSYDFVCATSNGCVGVLSEQHKSRPRYQT